MPFGRNTRAYTAYTSVLAKNPLNSQHIATVLVQYANAADFQGPNGFLYRNFNNPTHPEAAAKNRQIVGAIAGHILNEVMKIAINPHHPNHANALIVAQGLVSAPFFPRSRDHIDATTGKTPLHYAAHVGASDAMMVALRTNANFDTRDNDGRSALDIAILSYNPSNHTHDDAILALVNASTLQQIGQNIGRVLADSDYLGYSPEKINLLIHLYLKKSEAAGDLTAADLDVDNVALRADLSEQNTADRLQHLLQVLASNRHNETLATKPKRAQTLATLLNNYPHFLSHITFDSLAEKQQLLANIEATLPPLKSLHASPVEKTARIIATISLTATADLEQRVNDILQVPGLTADACETVNSVFNTRRGDLTPDAYRRIQEKILVRLNAFYANAATLPTRQSPTQAELPGLQAELLEAIAHSRVARVQELARKYTLNVRENLSGPQEPNESLISRAFDTGLDANTPETQAQSQAIIEILVGAHKTRSTEHRDRAAQEVLNRVVEDVLNVEDHDDEHETKINAINMALAALPHLANQVSYDVNYLLSEAKEAAETLTQIGPDDQTAETQALKKKTWELVNALIQHAGKSPSATTKMSTRLAHRPDFDNVDEQDPDNSINHIRRLYKLAVDNNQTETLDTLIKNYPQLLLESWDFNYNPNNAMVLTPLVYATIQALDNNIKIKTLQTLITAINELPDSRERKGIINIQRMRDAATLLHMAIIEGNQDNFATALALLDAKDIDVETPNTSNETPLSLACNQIANTADQNLPALEKTLQQLISKLKPLDTPEYAASRQARSDMRNLLYSTLITELSDDSISPAKKLTYTNILSALIPYIDMSPIATKNLINYGYKLAADTNPNIQKAAAAFFQQAAASSSISQAIAELDNTTSGGKGHGISKLLGIAGQAQGLLHGAAKANHPQLVNTIIEKSKALHAAAHPASGGAAVPPLNILRADADGVTPLHLAAESGHVNVVQALLTQTQQANQAVDITEHKDNQGRTLFDYAILGAAKRTLPRDPAAQRAMEQAETAMFDYLNINGLTTISEATAIEAFEAAIQHGRTHFIDRLVDLVEAMDPAAKASVKTAYGRIATDEVIKAAKEDPVKHEAVIAMLLAGYFTLDNSQFDKAILETLLTSNNHAYAHLILDPKHQVNLEQINPAIFDALIRTNNSQIMSGLRARADRGSAAIQAALLRAQAEQVKTANPDTLNQLLNDYESTDAEDTKQLLDAALSANNMSAAAQLLRRGTLDFNAAEKYLEQNIDRLQPTQAAELYAALNDHEEMEVVAAPGAAAPAPVSDLWNELLREPSPNEQQQDALACIAKRYPRLIPANALTAAIAPIANPATPTPADIARLKNVASSLLARRQALTSRLKEFSDPLSAADQPIVTALEGEIDQIETAVLNTLDAAAKSPHANTSAVETLRKTLYRRIYTDKFAAATRVPHAKTTELWFKTIEEAAAELATSSVLSDDTEALLRGMVGAHYPATRGPHPLIESKDGNNRTAITIIALEAGQSEARARELAPLLALLVEFKHTGTHTLSERNPIALFKMAHDAVVSAKANEGISAPLAEAYLAFSKKCYLQLHRIIQHAADADADPITQKVIPDLPIQNLYFRAIRENNLALVQTMMYLYPALMDKMFTGSVNHVAHQLTPLQLACWEGRTDCIDFLVRNPALKRDELTQTLKQLVDLCKTQKRRDFPYILDQVLRSAIIIDENMYNEILAYAKAEKAEGALPVLEASDLLDHINRPKSANASDSLLGATLRHAQIAEYARTAIRSSVSLGTHLSVTTETELRRAIKQVKYDSVTGYNIVRKGLQTSTSPDGKTLISNERLVCTPTTGSGSNSDPDAIKRINVETKVNKETGATTCVAKGSASYKLKAQIVAQNTYAHAISELKKGRKDEDGNLIPGSQMSTSDIDKLAFCQVVHSLVYGSSEDLATLAKALVDRKIFPVLTKGQLQKIAKVLERTGDREDFQKAYQRMEAVYHAHLTETPPTKAAAKATFDAQQHPGAKHLLQRLQADRTNPRIGGYTDETEDELETTSTFLNAPPAPAQTQRTPANQTQRQGGNPQQGANQGQNQQPGAGQQQRSGQQRSGQQQRPNQPQGEDEDAAQGANRASQRNSASQDAGATRKAIAQLEDLLERAQKPSVNPRDANQQKIELIGMRSGPNSPFTPMQKEALTELMGQSSQIRQEYNRLESIRDTTADDRNKLELYKQLLQDVEKSKRDPLVKKWVEVYEEVTGQAPRPFQASTPTSRTPTPTRRAADADHDDTHLSEHDRPGGPGFGGR